MIRKLLFTLALLFTLPAHADYLGDFAPATTAICGQYTTFNPSTGAPATLAGTPALAVYKIGDGTNSTTESTTGLTHAEDVDARTGMNRVCIDTSADGTFYSAGGQFSIVITTGTVNSVSVVGAEVKSFSLNKVAALRPTTAARTLLVGSAGQADANVTQYGGTNGTFASGRPEVNTTNLTGSALTPASCTGAIPALGIIDCGTAQAATATTLQLRSAANFDTDGEIIGATCVIATATTGAGQSRTVTAYTNSTDTATVATWTTTPTGTITYYCFGTSSGSASQVWEELVANHTTSGSVGERIGRVPNVAAAANGGLPTVDANNAVKVQSGTGANQISLSSGAVLLQATQTGVTIPTVTTVTNLTNAPTAGDLTATMKTSVGTAVNTAQGILTGTCSSGSTTTCVDAALNQAAASQLQDRLICFSDSYCAMLTTFTPGTHTVTTTKTAPATRSGLAYSIFPSTAQ